MPHKLFGHRDGAAPYSAAEWAGDAKSAIAEAHAAGRLPILVGGTGLYIRTLLDGIAPVPEIDAQIRADVRALTAEQAYTALANEDRISAGLLHPNDTARLQRALEVIRSTGRSIAAWRESRVGGIADTVTLEVRSIVMPVAELYARCDRRVDAMIEDGALDEVARLRERALAGTLPVMRAIGVAQLSRYLDGALTLTEAVAATKQATRNYAKRQGTWLRHQLDLPRGDRSSGTDFDG